MEIKIEIGNNLKSIMEIALDKAYVDDVEDIIKSFDLKEIAESFLKALMFNIKNESD